jgi:hypothetical protein
MVKVLRQCILNTVAVEIGPNVVFDDCSWLHLVLRMVKSRQHGINELDNEKMNYCMSR